MYLLFGARRLDGIGKSGGEKKKESTAKGFSSLDKRRTKGLCLFRYSVICTVQKIHRVGREERLKQVWTKSELEKPMDVLYKPYSSQVRDRGHHQRATEANKARKTPAHKVSTARLAVMAKTGWDGFFRTQCIFEAENLWVFSRHTERTIQVIKQVCFFRTVNRERIPGVPLSHISCFSFTPFPPAPEALDCTSVFFAL